MVVFCERHRGAGAAPGSWFEAQFLAFSLDGVQKTKVERCRSPEYPLSASRSDAIGSALTALLAVDMAAISELWLVWHVLTSRTHDDG